MFFIVSGGHMRTMNGGGGRPDKMELMLILIDVVVAALFSAS